MSNDLGIIFLWTVIGAGVGCFVMILAAGLASQQMLAATLQDATVWLKTPAMIGGAMGAARGFLKI